MPILGYFIYRDLGDGCIASKYSNLRRTRTFSESATKTVNDPVEPDHPFLGTFAASWIEDINPPESELVTLAITRKPGNSSQFILLWSDPAPNGQALFHGEGMMHDGILLGAYWNNLIENTPNLHTIVP